MNGDQRRLEAVGAGAEDITGNGNIVAEVEVCLNALRPAGMVGHSVGVPGNLPPAAVREIEALL